MLGRPSVILAHLKGIKEETSGVVKERLIFVVPKRRIYNALLTKLLPEFLMSHNQISSLNRYSFSPEAFKNLKIPTTEEEAFGPIEAKAEPSQTPEQVLASADVIYSKDQAGEPVVDASTFAKCVSILTTSGLSSK